MSLKFEKNSQINLKSKTNYLIIIALALMTHGVLVYNWVITRNLYNLIFMVAAAVFSICAIIPMIKEYYLKIRLVNDSELLKMQLDQVKDELSQIKESKKSIQVKLSQEMDQSSKQQDTISQFEQVNLEISNILEDIGDQMLVLNEGTTSLEEIVDRLNELRLRGVNFIKDLKSGAKVSEQTQADDEQFTQTFNKFMGEFQDMKDLIFQLKTLSFRVDVQASLLNDAEMTQSSSELEGLSRNLAKFYNNIIALLAGLEDDYNKNQQELSERVSTCISEINEYLDLEQDIAADLVDIRTGIVAMEEITENKLELVNETYSQVAEFDEGAVELICENTVISSTNQASETSSLVQ